MGLDGITDYRWLLVAVAVVVLAGLYYALRGPLTRRSLAKRLAAKDRSIVEGAVCELCTLEESFFAHPQALDLAFAALQQTGFRELNEGHRRRADILGRGENPRAWGMLLAIKLGRFRWQEQLFIEHCDELDRALSLQGHRNLKGLTKKMEWRKPGFLQRSC